MFRIQIFELDTLTILLPSNVRNVDLYMYMSYNVMY